MNGRTQFVVGWMALLFVISRAMSLGRLFGIRCWDREYALTQIQAHLVDQDMYNSTTLADVGSSYFQPYRYVFTLPHVLGDIFWWNLYFFAIDSCRPTCLW